MNFSYGVIAAVGVLAAISLVLIAMSPDEIISPRTMDDKIPADSGSNKPPVPAVIPTYDPDNIRTTKPVVTPGINSSPCVATSRGAPVCKAHPVTPGINSSPCVAEPESNACYYYKLYQDRCTDGKTYKHCSTYASMIKNAGYKKPDMMIRLASESSPNVSIPRGGGSLGCEATDECYLPYSLSVMPGTVVTWSNDDTVIHTVTSGADLTPDGFFDSGLISAGESFEFGFDGSGIFEYFCIVHPWMIGTVTVT